MSSQEKSDLEYSVRTLRRRLTEAEDTLDAIRGGEVDAVVVDGESGQQIYTLESPDEPFRIFVEQMQEGALTLNANGSIVYSNRFFADLVKHPLEQVRGQAMQHFVAAEDQTKVAKLIDAATRETVHGECSLRGSDGTLLPVQLAFNRLPAENLQMFGVVVTDLTERARAKQLEAKRWAAEQANAARDQFLAVVSHELRTPLHGIIGWTQVLRQRSDLSAPMQRGLEIIERNAWTQAQLIDDLLDVSGVLAGKLRLELQPVKLDRVIEAAVGTIQPAAQNKRIRLDIGQLEDTLQVRGDPDRLQQMVGNLLTNAVKFTPEGGEVRVSLRHVANEAEIEVSDTGIGIPDEYLVELFELYHQVEGSTTRRTGGLGLGLAIVKQLTELHGGKIWATSAGRDQGATFTLRLPLLVSVGSNEGADGMARSGSGCVLTGLRLLIIEDDEDAREMLTQVLGNAGAHVIPAATAAEALGLLEGEPVDLLVSDIGLPQMDGFELIRRIRASGRSGRDLPAVALTAFARREDRREALLAGYQVHFSKPTDHQELCAAIASLAGRPAH